MKIFREGLELPNAKVIYGADKQPEFVEYDGMRHQASYFVIEEDKKPAVKTKSPASKRSK